MKVNEILAKNIITKSNLPAANYVINPYAGCSHSCIYCYARFMKRFLGHEEKWGSFVDAKINAAKLIPDKLEKYNHKSIFLSSVTDPYLPLEKKYELTRDILKKFTGSHAELNIQTKSHLIARDVDILKKLNNCMAGLTLTTLDDAIRKEVEPYTSSVEKRIEALGKLKENGIKTYVFIGPIFPVITDWKQIILETRNFTDLYMFENLNAHGSIWHDIETWLEKKHPELLPLYRDIYMNHYDYWQPVEEEIKSFCKEEGVGFKLFFHHGKHKK